MGYDIKLYDLNDFLEAKYENGAHGNECGSQFVDDIIPVAETYLSYNFSAMKEIWCANSCFGRSTNEVIPELVVAYEKLRVLKYEPKIPKDCDIWTCKGENEYHVFCYHIKTLLDLFMANPYQIILLLGM